MCRCNHSIIAQYERTPLFLAAEKGNMDVLKALLDAGATVDAARGVRGRDCCMRTHQNGGHYC